MPPRLAIALPDSLLSDSTHLRDKTLKLGLIGRAAAIFRVTQILVYRDPTGPVHESKLIRLILTYLDTPQYLRRHLFPRRAELAYAGLLPPLRTPHHPLAVSLEELRPGEFREGVVVTRNNQSLVDVGVARPIPLSETRPKGLRITVRFQQGKNGIVAEPVARSTPPIYWGYEVSEIGSLQDLPQAPETLRLIATRQGRPINAWWKELQERLAQAQSLLLVFGAPTTGVPQMLHRLGIDFEAFADYGLNLFPDQGTETVRTEEAVLGGLAILNVLLPSRLR